MRVLLTGSSGFLGRHIMRLAAGQGVSVIRALRGEGRDASDALYLGSDIWGREHFAHALALSRADVVLHCAGVTRADGERHFFKANVFPTLGLLSAIAEMNTPPRVILIGSAAEYGIVEADCQPVAEDHPCRPQSMYGISKHAQTLAGAAARERGLPVLVVRVFNPVGQGMPPHLALPSFARRILSAAHSNTVMRVGNLNTERDFISVDEAARLLVELAQMPHWPWTVVNLCSGVAYRMSDMLAMMRQEVGITLQTEVDPALLRSGDMPRLVGSTERLRSLGLRPAVPDMGKAIAEMLCEARSEH